MKIKVFTLYQEMVKSFRFKERRLNVITYLSLCCTLLVMISLFYLALPKFKGFFLSTLNFLNMQKTMVLILAAVLFFECLVILWFVVTWTFREKQKSSREKYAIKRERSIFDKE